MRALILGSSGLLGSTLAKIFEDANYELIKHGYKSSSDFNQDLTNHKQTKIFLKKIKPDLIINLVGLTDVDRCEIDMDLAYKLNVQTIENISSYACQTKNCHLVHISTDQVYDGVGVQSEDSVIIRNYYAFSKYAGEIAARSCKSAILRTNFFGKSLCNERISFTDWIIDTLRNKKNINAFNDVFFNPLSMNTLSKIILEISKKRIIGTYNLGSKNPMSKADFIYKFADLMNLDTTLINKISIDDVDFIQTYRPKNMQMNCKKIELELDFKLPSLINELIMETRNYAES